MPIRAAYPELRLYRDEQKVAEGLQEGAMKNRYLFCIGKFIYILHFLAIKVKDMGRK
jgi:hypothetical protein